MSRIAALSAHLAGKLAPCYCAFVQVAPRFVSQEQIVEAAGAPSPVVRKWARWIREQLDQGASLDHLAELVRHGLGVPSAPILEADEGGEIAHATSEESEAREASPTNMDETALPEPPRVQLDSFNLLATERRLCELALERAGSIVGAAKLLGITRHALRRRMTKLGLADPRSE